MMLIEGLPFLCPLSVLVRHLLAFSLAALAVFRPVHRTMVHDARITVTLGFALVFERIVYRVRVGLHPIFCFRVSSHGATPLLRRFTFTPCKRPCNSLLVTPATKCNLTTLDPDG
jgi:hypothetical protein